MLISQAAKMLGHVRVMDRSILSWGGGGCTEPVLRVLGWVLVHALGGLFEGREGERETEPARV